jgi:hypothetical protein
MVRDIIEASNKLSETLFSPTPFPTSRLLEYPALLEISIVSSANGMYNRAFGGNNPHIKSYYLCLGSMLLQLTVHAIHKRDVSVRGPFRHK